MQVREHGEVVANDHGVAGHAHVRPNVRGRCAIPIDGVKPQRDWLAGAQGLRSVEADVRRGLAEPHRVVAGGRSAPRQVRQDDLADAGEREPGRLDDVGEQVVVTGRQPGQHLVEVAVDPAGRMEVRGAVERVAHDEQVHEVPVVLEQVDVRRGNPQLAAIHGHLRLPRLGDLLFVSRRVLAPPPVAEPEQRRDHDRRRADRHRRHLARPPRRLLPAGSAASRTAAPTIDTTASASTSMSPSSSAPSPRSMPRVRCATAGIGTDNTPCPFAPSTVILTCSEPRSISHRLAVNSCGSSALRSARSGVGGSSEPGRSAATTRRRPP